MMCIVKLKIIHKNSHHISYRLFFQQSYIRLEFLRVVLADIRSTQHLLETQVVSCSTQNKTAVKELQDCPKGLTITTAYKKRKCNPSSRIWYNGNDIKDSQKLHYLLLGNLQLTRDLLDFSL